MMARLKSRWRSLTTATLLGAAVMCFAFLAYAFTRFEPGASAVQLTVLYGLPALLGASALFALRHTVANRLKILMLTTSLGSSLLAGELFFSLTAPENQFPVGFSLPEADTRSMLDVVRDLRAREVDAFPDAGAWLLRDIGLQVAGESVVPLASGVPSSTIVFCNEGGEWVTYRSDEHGFRNPPGLWRDRIDVALIGDSFLLGQCVSERETLGALIRNRWLATLNLGVRGSGPLHQLAVLKEYGPVTQPRVTVWFYYEGNDFSDLRSEMSSPTLVRYLSDSGDQRIPERASEIYGALRAKLDSTVRRDAIASHEEPPRAWTVSSVLKLARLRGLVGGGIHFPEPDPMGRFPEILEVAKQTVETWDGDLILVLLPEYRRFSTFGSEATRRTGALRSIARQLEIRTVPVHEAFQEVAESPRDLWSHPRGHYSPQGYREVAKAVMASVEELLERAPVADSVRLRNGG